MKHTQIQIEYLREKIDLVRREIDYFEACNSPKAVTEKQEELRILNSILSNIQIVQELTNLNK